MILIDKLHEIIVGSKPMYSDKKVFVHKIRFLDQDSIAGHSDDVQLAIMPAGGILPRQVFGNPLKFHSRLFTFAIRNKKNISHQKLEELLTRYLKKFIDYSDDKILAIEIAEDIDISYIDQKDRVELAYTLIVNTVDLTDK